MVIQYEKHIRYSVKQVAEIHKTSDVLWKIKSNSSKNDQRKETGWENTTIQWMGMERIFQKLLFKRISWSYWLDMQGKGEGRTRDNAVFSSPGGWADEVLLKGMGKSGGEASICTCKVISSILDKKCWWDLEEIGSRCSDYSTVIEIKAKQKCRI